MRMRAWKTIGSLLLAAGVGAPLLAPVSAWAATRTTKIATSASGSSVCTKEGCSSASGDDQSGDSDRKLGTAVTWMSSPDAAARAASDGDKLVFMIQVSGNFARQEFT